MRQKSLSIMLGTRSSRWLSNHLNNYKLIGFFEQSTNCSIYYNVNLFWLNIYVLYSNAYVC